MFGFFGPRPIVNVADLRLAAKRRLPRAGEAEHVTLILVRGLSVPGR